MSIALYRIDINSPFLPQVFPFFKAVEWLMRAALSSQSVIWSSPSHKSPLRAILFPREPSLRIRGCSPFLPRVIWENDRVSSRWSPAPQSGRAILGPVAENAKPRRQLIGITRDIDFYNLRVTNNMGGWNVPKGTKSQVFWWDIFIFTLISIRYSSVPKGTKRLPKGKKCDAATAMTGPYNNLKVVNQAGDS